MAIIMFVFVTMAVAVVQANSLAAPAEEHSCSGAKDERSFLSTLLTVTGYSDACVAVALDICGSGGQDDRSHETFMEEAREVLQQVSSAVDAWQSQVSAAAAKLSPPRHCKDLQDYGDKGRGLRQVYPYPGRPDQNVTVYCDHTIDGGGWTVFQHRSSDAVRQDFYRGWSDYRQGFGDMLGEFWIGLDLLHQLTSITRQELRIDLHDYEGEHRWAKYKDFRVGSTQTNYRLNVGSYSGNAEDSLEYHNGMQFSTHDADNDDSSDNCAEERMGAWWYDACHYSNLNGYQYEGSNSPGYKGIEWYYWKGRGYSLQATSMMTRPAI